MTNKKRTPRAKKQTSNQESRKLKEQAFILEYLHNGMNATRAYMEVYASSEYSTARVLGSRLLAKVDIQSQISSELEHRVMGRSEALARLAAHARADIDDFITEEGSFDLPKARALHATGVIKKLKITEKLIRGESEIEASVQILERSIEVELHNSQHALEVILKTHGALIDKHELSGNVSVTSLADLVKNEKFDDE